VVERIFGVLKRRYRILLLAPEYSLEIQARIPSALAAIHNFIRLHDSEEGTLEGDIDDSMHGHFGEYSNPHAPATVEDEVDMRRDHIAQAMWDDYKRVCEERGIDTDDEVNSDDDELDIDSD
jgi:hypothetical protein